MNSLFIRTLVIAVVAVVVVATDSSVLLAENNVKAKSTVAKKFKQKKNPTKIDNFRDGNFSVQPEWWNFGSVSMAVVDNADDIQKMKKTKNAINLGKKSLQVQGITQRYYAGGVGVYLGLDGFDYTNVVMTVYSPKAMSGIIRIELFDDDNGNNRVDFGTNRNLPDSDDILVYHQIVDWEGWKVIRVPLAHFEDDNPRVGDNVFNPYRINRSAGLIQMQLVFLSLKEPDSQLLYKFDYIGLE